jgi:hypothetical protein
VPGLDGWLASLFDEEHLDHTCEVLAGSDELDTETWIAEVERERKTAQAQFGRVVPGGKLTKSQHEVMVIARDV